MRQVKIKMFGKILSLLTLTSGSIQAMELAHVEDKSNQIQVFYDKLVALNPTCQFNKQQIFDGYITGYTDEDRCVGEYRIVVKEHTINLSNQGVQVIPTEIGLCRVLEELNLSSNQLTSLPTEIGLCIALKKAFITNNRLASIPTEIGLCRELEALYLSDNELTTIPTEIKLCTALRELGLSFNQLASIPTEIERCTALEQLHLYDNPQLASLFGSKWSQNFDEKDDIATFRQLCENMTIIKENYMLLINLSAEDSPIYIPKELIDVIFNIIWELQKK